MSERIEIIHTNDLHSHFENWPKMRRYLLAKRELAAHKKQPFLSFDLGDFSDRWHPLTEATHGLSSTQLMNAVSYDAVTIGNNEGVGLSHDDLNHLYDEANFPVLLANLIDPTTGQRPTWAKKQLILTTASGTKIGLFGLTAPFPKTYGPNGWTILNYEDVLPKLIKTLRPQVDVLIFLSHLGIGDDRKIATQYPELDVIIESHTHHAFLHGEFVAGTLLAAAGKFGEYLGEVELEVDETHHLKNATAWLVATKDLAESPDDADEIQSYLAGGRQLLAQHQLARLPRTYTKNLNSAHTFIHLAQKAIEWATEIPVSILNSGLFLTDLRAGVVTEDTLHQAIPHPMHLIKVTLLGRDLTRLIFEMEKNRYFLRAFPIVGMGFRGKIFGEIVYDGLTYLPESRDVFYLNEKVDPEKYYTIVTVDHFMFVPFFPTIEIAGQVEFIFPDFLRQVIGKYLEVRYPI